MDGGRDTDAKAHLDQLFVRIKAGDRKAVEVVYRLTASMLLGLVQRIVKRRDAAEDIVQDTFLTLWQRRAECDATRGSPVAWLAIIARHKAIDYVRRPGAKSTEQDVAEIDVADEFVDPLAALEKAQDQARVVADLSRIDPERLQMILLAFVFGWSREQLGQHFHKPTGTIKTWLHRTLAEIQVNACSTDVGKSRPIPTPVRPEKMAKAAVA